MPRAQAGITVPRAVRATNNEEKLAIASADRKVCCHLPDSALKRLQITRMHIFLRIGRSDRACYHGTCSPHPTHDDAIPLVLICPLFLS